MDNERGRGGRKKPHPAADVIGRPDVAAVEANRGQASEGWTRTEGATTKSNHAIRLLLLLLLGEAVLLPHAEKAPVGARNADLVEGIELLHL